MMTRDVEIHEMMLEDFRHDPRRAGEGDVVELAEGRLLLLYSLFEQGGDHSSAPIVRRTSSDGGVTWSEAKTIFDIPQGSLNVMSVSLLRLADGRLACSYLHKHSLDDCYPVWRVSEDEGESWSEPRRIPKRPGYYVVNNNRLAQLSSGRLLIPYAWRVDAGLSIEAGRRWGKSVTGCFISDDAGETWHASRQEHAIENRDLVPYPEPVDPDFVAQAPSPEDRRPRTQEPGVVELSGGEVLLYARSDSGYAWRCFSGDGGETWSRFEPIREFPMPCGPATIQRLPGTDRLVMIYNDRTGVPYSTGCPFMWRTPLAAAVSDDNGRSWNRLARDVESDDRVNYCYTSLLFFENQRKAILTYYVGWPSETGGSGRPKPVNRRNLASLKVNVLGRKFFEGKDFDARGSAASTDASGGSLSELTV